MAGEMTYNDWDDHWQTGTPFWHENIVNSSLIKFRNLTAKNAFVPLCGKTIDMIWYEPVANSNFRIKYILGCNNKDAKLLG